MSKRIEVYNESLKRKATRAKKGGNFGVWKRRTKAF
jgi:hypothetical protein